MQARSTGLRTRSTDISYQLDAYYGRARGTIADLRTIDEFRAWMSRFPRCRVDDRQPTHYSSFAAKGQGGIGSAERRRFRFRADLFSIRQPEDGPCASEWCECLRSPDAAWTTATCCTLLKTCRTHEMPRGAS